MIKSMTTLASGIFKDAQDKGNEYLHYLEPDRLLAPCYEAIGLTPKAPRYGGWEAKDIAGHSLGHYLSAVSQMYETTKDALLEERIDYLLNEMDYLQKKEGTGYISGFKGDCFDRVFTGEFDVERFSLGGSWVPWYSIHKIFQGLVDVYLVTGKEKALDIVCQLSDWALEGTSGLNDDQFEKMLYCEFGGMNEVMAQLYEITGKKGYLHLARRFCHNELLDPIESHEDCLEGMHANTQIPKVLGVAKLFEVERNPKDFALASYFFDRVMGHRSYVIGGNSYSEHFVAPDKEPLGILTTETCNTYNMMKLAAYLFKETKDSKYMAYYEKALINHIMTSQDPDTGMKAYFVPTEPGHFKTYCSPDDSFWCCTGSGMENPAKFHQEIFHYFEEDKTVTVDQFISSKIDTGTGISLSQKTDFPFEKGTTIEVLEWQRGYDLRIRVPEYLTDEPMIYINGELMKEVYMANQYIFFDNNIKVGDKIELGFDYGLRSYHAMDDESKVAFLYGPVVLAAALGTENFPDSDIHPNHLEYVHHPKIQVPILVDDLFDDTLDQGKLSELIIPVDEQKLIFKTKAVGQPGEVSLSLVPFFKLHHERYSLYFQTMTKKQYDSEGLTSQSYMDKLSAITVDQVSPFEQQSEIEHEAQYKGTSSGYATEASSGWREAGRGVDLTYSMKVIPDIANYLCVTYWGNDGDVWAPDGIFSRRFQIRINDEVLATEHLIGEKGSRLYQAFYKLPVLGEKKVKVTFKSEPNTIAGRIFGVRITKGVIEGV